MLKELPGKFSVYIPTEEVSKMVQEKLLSLGYEWFLNNSKEYKELDLYPCVITYGVMWEVSPFRKKLSYRYFEDADSDYLKEYPLVDLSEIIERKVEKKECKRVNFLKCKVNFHLTNMHLCQKLLEEHGEKCCCIHQ